MARRPALWVPERGEIIFIEHSPHVGKAMPGLHPTLACSTAAFAGKAGVVIGFAMATAEFNADNPFALAVKGPKNEIGVCSRSSPSLSTGVRATHVLTPGARGTPRCSPLRSRSWRSFAVSAITETTPVHH